MSKNGPLCLASFVTKDDPATGEVAGLISGKLPDLDATGLIDESATANLYALYDFERQNNIAYQSVPRFSTVPKWYSA